MPEIVAKMLDQTIGSTHVDSQGEKFPKCILDNIAQRKQTPISQNHQPERPSIGYMDNFRVIQDPKNNHEWLLKADLYYYEKPKDFAVGGISWSSVELIGEYKATKKSSCAIYLPWPYYNNKLLLDELRNTDESLSIGRWYKKSADPTTISLIVGFVLFAFSPVWNKIFDNVIWPRLSKVFSVLPSLRKKGIQRFDFVQLVEIKQHQVNVYLIPEAEEEVGCFSKENVTQGLKKIYDYSEKDTKAINPGYRTIKLCWNNNLMKYELFHIEFNDGTAVNVIGKNI